MIYIAHRGNTQGPNPEYENNPDYIDEALERRFVRSINDAEIDLRCKDGDLYLGHDTPQYKINVQWLVERSYSLWVHCKDPQAFDVALELNLNCFWHNSDDYTLTKYGYVWAYPGLMPIGYKTIMVLPSNIDLVDMNSFDKAFGICSDNVDFYRANERK